MSSIYATAACISNFRSIIGPTFNDTALIPWYDHYDIIYANIYIMWATAGNYLISFLSLR